VTETRNVFGKIGAIRTVSEGAEPSQVQLQAQGLSDIEGCGAFRYLRLTGGASPDDFLDPVIDSIV
jgi:hypothetical protein